MAKSRKRKIVSRKVHKTVRKSSGKVVTMRQKIQAVYGSSPLDTTCCRQCTCCMVACPQMNQCEAATILDKIWSSWLDMDRKKFIVKCMRYFFSNSMVNPCPLLGRGVDGLPGCMEYDDRPLNCRVYGQWSQEAYEKRVTRFIEATGFEKKSLPLNVQCRHVVNPAGVPSKETIDDLFSQLDTIDMVVYGYDQAKIDKRYNYRTIHDWALAKYLGEDRLSTLSTFFLACTKEQAEDYLEKFERALMGDLDVGK